MDERIERARRLYERAVFGGDGGALTEADRDLDSVEADLDAAGADPAAAGADPAAAEADPAAAEADLALARGRVTHARFLLQRDEDPDRARADPGELALFERAAELYRARGDIRGEAESMFWIGCFRQVVGRDNDAAVPALDRSFELASQVGDKPTMSEALRHLGIAAHAAGRLDEARERLEESTRLRREIGLLPGVAANLIGLAYIAAGQDRHDDALALLAEAGAIAEACDAQRILRSVREALAEL